LPAFDRAAPSEQLPQTRKCELLSFHSLAHSFAQAHSTTPLQSYSSALFSKNTGAGYTPPEIRLMFSRVSELFKFRPSMPAPILLGSLPAVAGYMRRQVVPLETPLCSRWSSVVFPRKTLSISFPFMSLPDHFRHNEGGYTPSPCQEPACPGRFGLSRLPSRRPFALDGTHPPLSDCPPCA
jgi:hypothetical protein